MSKLSTPMMHSIYLAARYSRHAEMRQVRDEGGGL